MARPERCAQRHGAPRSESISTAIAATSGLMKLPAGFAPIVDPTTHRMARPGAPDTCSLQGCYPLERSLALSQIRNTRATVFWGVG